MIQILVVSHHDARKERDIHFFLWS